MSDFVIVTDTASDADAALRERFGIDGCAQTILYHLDGHESDIDVDNNSDLPLDEFYASMKGRKAMYTTAAPRSSSFISVMEKPLSEGKDVISVSLSTGLSATFRDANIVAAELRAKYPERKIICIDSLCFSTSIVLLIALGQQKKAEGATIEEVADYMNEMKYRIHQMGALDDLYFAAKHGRCSNFKAFMGTMAGINMMAEINYKGAPEVIGKFKGKKEANAGIVNYVKRVIENPEEQILFITHSNRKQMAEDLAASVKATLNPKEVIVTELGKSCGASIGPGLVTCFFVGHKKEDGIMFEKQAMSEVIAASKSKK